MMLGIDFKKLWRIKERLNGKVWEWKVKGAEWNQFYEESDVNTAIIFV